MPYRLIARIFMRAESAAVAASQQARLLTELAAFAPSLLAEPQPYPKIPGLFEHSVALAPATPETFESVLALAPAGWHVMRDTDCSAVWNPVPGCIFLGAEVQWAEILLVQPPASLS